MIDSNKIRLDFPILQTRIYDKDLIYLDNAATTQKPQVVLDKVMDFYTSINSNIHRGVHQLSTRSSEAYEQARRKVKDFINAEKVNEVIFTHGTTESINLVAHSFGQQFIRPGDEIIITEMEHHSNILPWQFMCKQKQAVLKVIPFNNEGILDIPSFQALLSDKTKLISLTYVSNVLGTINPVKKIIEMAHRQDIPVVVDGAQAVQHMPIDVQDLDCDFFVFSGHKMYAETGIGVLYGKEKWLEQLPPYQTGGGMIDSVSFEKTTVTSLPLKFEAGTANYVAAVSLATAIDYLQHIGLEHIHTYEQDLLQYADSQLKQLDGLTLYGNAPRRCGALSFNLQDIHPFDAGTLLDKLGIAIRTGTHCAEPVMQHYGITGAIRASFGVYNTREDIDALIQGLHKTQKMLTA